MTIAELVSGPAVGCPANTPLAEAADLAKLTVGDIMTAEPDTIDVETDIEDAIDWLNATG